MRLEGLGQLKNQESNPQSKDRASKEIFDIGSEFKIAPLE
jgi:hypothetical protein